MRRSRLLLSQSLTSLSITDAASGLRDGAFSAVQLTTACLQQIKRSDQKLNAYITVSDESALLREAAEADKRLQAGAPLSNIDGVPIAVKDNFCTHGIRTTAGSKFLDDFAPPYESTTTSKLKASGAIIVGKTNMDEFGMGSANIYSHFGDVVNPWSPPNSSCKITAGGSSGGSAAAVSARTCLAAIGSDTGGSVRQPAAYCGLVGLKPTYGRVSRHGLISYASSLDTPGVLAHSVRDAAMILDAVAGPCEKDSTCLRTPYTACAPSLGSADVANSDSDSSSGSARALEGVTVGVPDEYRLEELPASMLEMWTTGVQWLEEAGAEVVSVSVPTIRHALPAYYIIASAEACSNLNRYDGVRYGSCTNPEPQFHELAEDAKNDVSVADLHEYYSVNRSQGFGAEVQRRLLSGSFVLSAGAYADYYEKALLVRQSLRDDFATVFENGVDVLLGPTTPSGPFEIRGQKDKSGGGSNGEHENLPITSMFLNDVMTIPPSLAGLPAVSVPVAVTQQQDKHTGKKFAVPLALQLCAAPEDELTVLKVALALEKKAGFTKMIPQYVYTHSE